MMTLLEKCRSILGFKADSHIVLLLAIGFAVFLTKCAIVYPIQYVGYADAAGYAEMADSLVHGRGFQVDYISWYFMKYDPKVSRPEDHWPPLYSIAIAPFFLIFGKTAFAAKLPSIIISCFFLPLVVYLITKELTGSKFPGIAAGLSVLFYPVIFEESLWCLSDILYSFLVCAGVFFSMKSLDDERFLYPLGVFMGLAYYAKGSGLILIPGYILFQVIARRSVKKVLTNRKLLISLLIAFLILLPWFIRNYVHFRDPLFSTQRFVSGYIGYEDWEAGAYELYWGEKPPPSYLDKVKEIPVFSLGLDFQRDLDRDSISEKLWYEFKNNRITLSPYAVVSVRDRGRKWLIEDEVAYPVGNEVIYTIRKKGDKLNVYRGGIYSALKTTLNYIKRHFWLIFLDINSGRLVLYGENSAKWEGTPRDAFPTYFLNMPALLGIILPWRNRKRYAIWIIAGSLAIFMSVVWSPIYRLVLPITSLMIALSWVSYFAISKMVTKLLRKPLHQLGRRLGPVIIASKMPTGNGNQEVGKHEEMPSDRQLNFPERTRPSLDSLAGILVCCLAVIVLLASVGNIYRAYKRGVYPYHDSAWDCIDMGRWLRENASPDSITMTEFPWDLHFYSEQRAIQLPRTDLGKTIEVMRFYKPEYLLLIALRIRYTPSLIPLVTGKVPGLELVYDNGEMRLYKIHYDFLPHFPSRGL